MIALVVKHPFFFHHADNPQPRLLLPSSCSILEYDRIERKWRKKTTFKPKYPVNSRGLIKIPKKIKSRQRGSHHPTLASNIYYERLFNHELMEFKKRMHPSDDYTTLDVDLGLQVERDSEDEEMDLDQEAEEQVRLSPTDRLILESFSPLEKIKFFRSIARHSKLRPDLISRDLGGSKSSSMISSLISVFDHLAKDNPIAFESNQSRFRLKPSSSSKARKDATLNPIEKNINFYKKFKIANQVTEEWIEMEDKEAFDMLIKETGQGLTDYRLGIGDRIDNVKEILRNRVDLVVDSLNFRSLDKVFG